MPFDPLTAGLLDEKVFQDPDYDPERCLLTDDSSAFGMAVTRSNGMSYLKLLCVAPEARRRGWGTKLLSALESGTMRAWESHPNYLLPGQDVRYTDGVLFLEKRGYRKVGETFNLVCDLTQDFRDPQPDHFQVRRALHTDREQLMVLVDLHFSVWRAEVTAMFANHPVSVHVAFQHGELLGFSGYDSNNRGTGWFGPMGTHPKARGTGMGRALLRCCLEDLKEQGHAVAIIPWVGPYGFYAQHCGARIDRVFWRYEKTV